VARRALACSQKKAEQEKRQIVFVDESGFYLLPMAVRTYAPVGQTPILRVPLTRDHISAIGALTPEGRLFMQTQDHSYKGEDVVRFLKQLLRQIPGKVLIIWDGSPIHHCQAIKDFWRLVLLHAFTWNVCLPMHPSSIQRSGFGISSNGAN
jgi:DDE superfamily endonuclease